MQKSLQQRLLRRAARLVPSAALFAALHSLLDRHNRFLPLAGAEMDAETDAGSALDADPAAGAEAGNRLDGDADGSDNESARSSARSETLVAGDLQRDAASGAAAVCACLGTPSGLLVDAGLAAVALATDRWVTCISPVVVRRLLSSLRRLPTAVCCQ